MKQEFLDFITALMEANPEVAAKLMTDDIQHYIDLLKEIKEKEEKPIITDNGKMILKYMQECGVSMLKAKDIAEGLYISSRGVSGAIRKLVSDGFCEKMGESPVIYSLTEKGKNFKIEGEN